MLSWIIVVFAGLAAVLWLLSALVKIPDILDSGLEGETTITAAMKRQARLSAAGAICAAISAASQAIATFLTTTQAQP
jgi:hypothetical protein